MASHAAERLHNKRRDSVTVAKSVMILCSKIVRRTSEDGLQQPRLRVAKEVALWTTQSVLASIQDVSRVQSREWLTHSASTMHSADSRKPSRQREHLAGEELFPVHSQITKANTSLCGCQDRKGKAWASLQKDAHKRRRHAGVRGSAATWTRHAAANQAIGCNGSQQLGDAVGGARKGQTQVAAQWIDPGGAQYQAGQGEHMVTDCAP
eukprot:6172950-Pleurochrysis_carterae.AAC.3